MAVLIIFIKNPILGKVKTRLASTLGDQEALRIYKLLLQHTRTISMSIDVKRALYYSDSIDETDNWEQFYFSKKLQPQGALGQRMAVAFQKQLKLHDKAVIIGSDCANLSPEIIQEALNKLDQHDFVIGPTFDGGYYLLGMKHYHSSLFENIEWSTEKVLPQTLEKIASLEKSYYLLPKLSDIDYEKDWLEFGKHLDNQAV